MPDAPEPKKPAHKVLVIDDDPDVCYTLSLRLQSFGYGMVSASSGEEGLRKAKEVKPRIIILDFTLKEETGLDILKQLKTPGPAMIHQIPVVMLTAHEQHEKACLEAGAAGYITKPFDLFQLKETLSKFLSK